MMYFQFPSVFAGCQMFHLHFFLSWAGGRRWECTGIFSVWLEGEHYDNAELIVQPFMCLGPKKQWIWIWKPWLYTLKVLDFWNHWLQCRGFVQNTRSRKAKIMPGGALFSSKCSLLNFVKKSSPNFFPEKSSPPLNFPKICFNPLFLESFWPF